MSTPSRLPLHSLALDSPTPNTNMKVTGGTGTKTPSSTTRRNLKFSQSHSKRKRENELFHTKRINNKSSSNETMNSNTSISLKSRIRTIKKIDSIARAWIDSGNELVGLQMNLMGELICCQRDKLILFSRVQTSTVTPVEVNRNDNLDDFDMINTIATISIDDNTSRKYLTAVDRDGRVINISHNYMIMTLYFHC